MRENDWTGRRALQEVVFKMMNAFGAADSQNDDTCWSDIVAASIKTEPMQDLMKKTCLTVNWLLIFCSLIFTLYQLRNRVYSSAFKYSGRLVQGSGGAVNFSRQKTPPTPISICGCGYCAVPESVPGHPAGLGLNTEAIVCWSCGPVDTNRIEKLIRKTGSALRVEVVVSERSMLCKLQSVLDRMWWSCIEAPSAVHCYHPSVHQKTRR